ncbi:MAG: ATP-dependent protease La, ATP-dependent Lon protease [Microgenomates group bacterium GW2011_GWC1_49_7]|nr:MAG: ATP-dependent protease La, ATP-dependent Lon protease [Microgenomates group bacterium GW2011_GWC1_49_7]
MSKLTDQVADLQKKVTAAKLPKELETRVLSNLEEVIRLENDIAARVHIEQMLRYIDWVVNLPWNERTTDVLDLTKAKEILEKHHYGLAPVKARILEYLSILKLNKERWEQESKAVADESKLSHAMLARRAPILCLVGLVGTGKTTLAKSIAQAMGRRFVRIPFGGMSDALDLRGQARVRPDAEIGLIMKGMRFAGSKNPVILLDEIDRVAEQTRGDIMGVLVELLDPEQNVAFTDHYLDYPFDLSDVLFIATANNTTNIATAVLDRLEPIQMPSYSDEEKIKIAKDYVLPELMRESGLTKENLIIDEAIWPKLVRPLGYDAGIRSLERTINGVCRKVAHMIVEGKGKSFRIDESNIKEFVESY